MDLANSPPLSIEVGRLGYAPGLWDAWLIGPLDRERTFIGTFGSKRAAGSAAKAELCRREELALRSAVVAQARSSALSGIWDARATSGERQVIATSSRDRNSTTCIGETTAAAAEGNCHALTPFLCLTKS